MTTHLQETPCLPAATDDHAQAARDLAQHGFCLVRDVLVGDRLAEVRTRIDQAAADDRAVGVETDFRLDLDQTNQRVWGLLSRGRPFVELAEHPLALELVGGLLGRPLLLSNISANITRSGGGEMQLHADQTYMPMPWAGPQGANVMWLIDDFTAENGGTIIVPGSHLHNRRPEEADMATAGVPLEAPAGTMCVMDGRIWHKTGSNSSNGISRAGIFAWYTLPIYRPQENWFLSLDPHVLQNASATLIELLGYGTSGLGRVNGVPPAVGLARTTSTEGKA